MITLLTASETLTSPTSAHRYMVELASIEMVLDSQGISVLADFKMLDVCVVDPTLDAITTLLQCAEYLQGYQIVSHWVAQDCDCF